MRQRPCEPSNLQMNWMRLWMEQVTIWMTLGVFLYKPVKYMSNPQTGSSLVEETWNETANLRTKGDIRIYNVNDL